MAKRSSHRAKAKNELNDKIRRIFTAIGERWEPEHWLSRIEAAARAELERYERRGVRTDADLVGEAFHKLGRWPGQGEVKANRATADEKVALSDAHDILCRVTVVRGQVARGETAEAVVNALLIGAAFERLGIWPINADIRRGSKCQEGGREGNRLAYGTPDEQADKRRRIREAVAAEKLKHPSFSATRIYELVAARLQADGERCSVRTVIRAVKHPEHKPQ